MLCIYRILLDCIYGFYIAPHWSYQMGLVLDTNITKIFISYIWLIIIIFITPSEEEHLTSVLINVQLLVMLMPMLSLYAMSNRSSAFISMVCIAHIMQCLIIRFIHKCACKSSNIVFKNSKFCMRFLCAFLLAIAVLYSFYKYGVASLTALDLTQVYTIRETISYSFPFSYIVPWVFKVLCIFLFLIFLDKRNYIGALAASTFQIYFYLTYANKQTLFSWLLAITCYFFVKRRALLKKMALGLSALLIGSSLIYQLFGNILLISYLVRRSLFVPAVLKFSYYDFFSANSLLYMADNTIGKLLGITSTYDMLAPKLIAVYLGVPNSYCNTGYWGDAFANLGIVGLFLYSIILICFLLLVEHIVKKIPRGIYLPFAITLFYNLNDSSMLTWMLSGGGGLMVLLLWLYRNSTKKDVYKIDKIQENYI